MYNLIDSVDDDEIIIDVLQYTWSIWSNKLQFIDWSSISIFIEDDPIISPFPCQYRIQQRLLFNNLLKFKLFVRLLSTLQQDFHVLAEFTQIFIESVENSQLLVQTLAKGKSCRKAYKACLWSIQ